MRIYFDLPCLRSFEYVRSFVFVDVRGARITEIVIRRLFEYHCSPPGVEVSIFDFRSIRSEEERSVRSEVVVLKMIFLSTFLRAIRVHRREPDRCNSNR